MNHARTTTARDRRGALVLMLALLAASPWLAWSAIHVRSNTADMKQWLPEGRREVRQYQQFIEQFGIDDFVLITWDGCSESDPRLAAMAEALRTELESTDQLWHRVTTGPEQLRLLTSEPAELERDRAMQRLRGLIFGPDNATCVLLGLTTAGRERPHDVLQAIQRCGRDINFEPNELRLAGSVYKAAAIDQTSSQAMRRRTVWSAVVTLVVALLMLRSLRLTVAVLAPAAFCGALSVGLLYWSGRGMNAVLIVLPTLIYVLTVSGAVHLVNYLRDAERGGAEDPIGAALRAGWKPCALAALSTAVGMASLGISELSPVRDFGLFSSASLVLSLFFMIAWFYAVLRTWRWPAAAAGDVPAAEFESPSSRVDRWAELIVRHYQPAILVGIGVLLLLGAGLWQTTSSVDMLRAFRTGHKLRTDYQWIERNLASLGAVEVVVAFPADCDWKPIRRLEAIQEACDRLAASSDAGPAMSAATFAPPTPDFGGFAGVFQRTVFNRRLAEQRPRLMQDGWLAETSDAELWRLHVRIPETGEVEYGDAVGHLDELLAPVFEASGASVNLTYTGGYPLIAAAQHQLLNDLSGSFCLAFAILCPLIMIVLRSVGAGLVAMIPNLAPVVMVFGVMAWAGIPIEIGAMLTASVALGIAVDDTLHFLTWYRRSHARGATRRDAVLAAYRRCAPAMIQTTVICSCGMLPLLGAEFVPASQFAGLLIVLLLAALFGDLVLLPALLVSPLGKSIHDDVVGDEARNDLAGEVQA